MSESKRQLAAIMFTDIVGFTSVMGENEAKAFELIEKNRQIQKPSIEKHRGIWLKEMGDGTLSSFTTVSDAVSCALEIQRAWKDEEGFKIRIGIHLGEVVMEDGDVFGDGVNIASRIESFAPAGGIMVSDAVYQNIRNKAGIEAQFIREATLKNVKEPVKLYEVKIDGELKSDLNGSAGQKRTRKPVFFLVALLIIALALIWLWVFSPFSGDGPSFGLAGAKNQGKSIAVLPFKYQGNDKTRQYWAAGISSSINDYISTVPGFEVIPYLSVLKFRGTSQTVRSIANELGAAYLLVGDVRVMQDQLRLTVHLMDSVERQVYFKEYVGSFEEVNAMQREIISAIAEKLDVLLSDREKRQMQKSPTENPKAYEHFMKGRSFLTKYMLQVDEHDFVQADVSYQTALKLDENFADVYADLGQLYAWKMYMAQDAKNIRHDTIAYFALKALQIDAELAKAHFLLGWKDYLYETDYKRAIRQLKKSISINQSDAWSYHVLGNCYRELGQWENGLINYRMAEKMDKGSPLQATLLEDIGTLYLKVGDYESAGTYFQQALSIQPDLYWAYKPLKYAMEARGAFEEELALVQRFYKLNSNSGVAVDLAVCLGFANRFVDSERYWEKVESQLRKANVEYLPEGHRYAHTLWMLGKKNKARRLFKQHMDYCQQVQSSKEATALALYDQAAIQAFLGKEKEAIQFLKEFSKADAPPYLVSFLAYDPQFASMKESEIVNKLISEYKARYSRIQKKLKNIQH